VAFYILWYHNLNLSNFPCLLNSRALSRQFGRFDANLEAERALERRLWKRLQVLISVERK
jgi:hypothetical protein